MPTNAVLSIVNIIKVKICPPTFIAVLKRNFREGRNFKGGPDVRCSEAQEHVLNYLSM